MDRTAHDQYQSFTTQAGNLAIHRKDERYGISGLVIRITLDNGEKIMRPLNKRKWYDGQSQNDIWTNSSGSKRDLHCKVNPWTIWERAEYDPARLRVITSPNGKDLWTLAFLPRDELQPVLTTRMAEQNDRLKSKRQQSRSRRIQERGHLDMIRRETPHSAIRG